MTVRELCAQEGGAYATFMEGMAQSRILQFGIKVLALSISIYPARSKNK